MFCAKPLDLVAARFLQRITQLVDLVARFELAQQFVEQRVRRHEVQPLPLRVDDVLLGGFVPNAELVETLLEELGNVWHLVSHGGDA